MAEDFVLVQRYALLQLVVGLAVVHQESGGDVGRQNCIQGVHGDFFLIENLLRNDPGFVVLQQNHTIRELVTLNQAENGIVVLQNDFPSPERSHAESQVKFLIDVVPQILYQKGPDSRASSPCQTLDEDKRVHEIQLFKGFSEGLQELIHPSMSVMEVPEGPVIPRSFFLRKAQGFSIGKRLLVVEQRLDDFALHVDGYGICEYFPAGIFVEVILLRGELVSMRKEI